MTTNMPPALNELSASDCSSDISSPPRSPEFYPFSFDEIAVARLSRTASAFGEGVVGATSAHVPRPGIATAQNTPPLPPQSQPVAAPVKVKKPRKPREPKEAKPAPDGQPPKEKKPRKPREPKVKTEGAPNPTSRKKQKVGDKAVPHAPPTDSTGASRQSTLIGQFYPPGQPASTPQHPQSQPPPLGPSPLQQHPSTPADISRAGIAPQLPSQQSAPMPRPYSGGQNYDPIRGATYDHNASRPAMSTQASPQINRASASPSIQSLIDPPQHTQTSTPTVSYIHQANLQPVPQQTASFVHTSPRPTPVPSVIQSLPPSPRPTQLPQPTVAASIDGAMDIDTVPHDAPQQSTSKPQALSKSASSAPTPKASKPATPPAKAAAKTASGSGLLSNNALFGGSLSEVDLGSKGLTIDFQMRLDPKGENQINIAKEIIKRYGGDAVDPHAAAHRARMRAVAMAQNKLDANSNDDMSVDLGSELDGDSNVEMGGVDDERSGAGGEPVRKRRKKVEEYDKEDDFIDDRELAWEENAAVAKDGFFVYSGPLVAEGEAAQVETSAPTRGRGGARGRGKGRGGATAAAGAPAASATRKDLNGSAAPSRGRGSRGGRGTAIAVVRKRATKAEKDKVEAERLQREQLLVKPQHVPPPGPNVSTSAKSPALGMGAATIPAPIQSQHVLHSSYNASLPAAGDAQRSGVQA